MTAANDGKSGKQHPPTWQTHLQIFAPPVIAVVVLAVLFALYVLLPSTDKEHPVFSAPFQIFLSVILIITIFYAPIKSLLSRGTLSISWGDKTISITEIESNVDEQFNDYETRLDELREELVNEFDEKLQNLSEEVEAVRRRPPDQRTPAVPQAAQPAAAPGASSSTQPSGAAASARQSTIPTGVSQKIKAHLSGVHSDQFAALIYHLGMSKYK